jgi:hypothetical protein
LPLHLNRLQTNQFRPSTPSLHLSDT